MSRGALTLVGVAAVAWGACGGREAPVEPAVPPGRAAVAAGDVVATVNGRPITAEAVRVQARAAGVDARTALSQLVDAELVAEVAEGRGLAAAPEVDEAKKQALVRRYLAESFAREVTQAVISDDELRRLYEANKMRFDHPELVEVRHIVGRAEGKDPPERHAVVRGRVAQAAERAKQAKTADDFKAIAAALSDAQVRLKAEDVVTALRHWTVPRFADAAFALARPGEVSGVVETEYGYHVIWMLRRIPEEHRDFAAAREELRAAYWPEAQRREFARWVGRQMEQHEVSLQAERLGPPVATAGRAGGDRR